MNFGKSKLKVIYTPGHTLESTCYVLSSDDKDVCIFSGDTILLGDVGRVEPSEETTAGELIVKQFESIQKLKTLPKDLKIFPGHCNGTACAKNLVAGDSSTI